MADCTILIPTYFGNNMMHNCVKSVLDRVEGAKVMVYKNDVGWLQACNKMMETTTGDVLLLNDDTVVLTDVVKEIQALLAKDDTIGIVGGKALDMSSQTIINYGIYVGPDGNTAHMNYGVPRHEVKVEKRKAVEGSLFYIRRAVIDALGYFDPRYTMGYRAEVDYCFRAREAGYKVMSCPTAEYVHFVSQTNSQLNIKNDTYDVFMEQWGTKLRLGQI